MMEDDLSPQDEQLEVPGVDLQVIDYYYIGDGEAYEQHYFVIQVADGKEKYVVDRSYVDFVILYRNLKKCYMGSNIPELPLRGTSQIEAVLTKEAPSLADVRKRVSKDPLLVSSRISMDSIKRRSLRQNSISLQPSTRTDNALFPIPEESVEIISAMGPILTLFLVDLTCHHELLVSDDLHSFLDEEVTDLLVPIIPPTLTAFDLALLNQSLRSTVVSKQEEHRFKVAPRHVVVWRFSTQNYDIAFGVEVNGQARIPLTRYRSQDQPICGAMYIDQYSDCILHWDNSYAKLHSKQLQWSLRVLSVQEFETMKLQTTACLREKKRFETQRLRIRRSTYAHAARLSGVVHGSLVEADYAEEQAAHQRELQREVSKLAEQNRLLLSDLEQVEVKLEDLEAHHQALLSSKDLLSESWRFSNSQLTQVETRNQELQAMLSELQAELVHKDAELQETQDLLEGSREHNRQLQAALQAVVANLQPKLESDGRACVDWAKKLSTREENDGSATTDWHAECQQLLHLAQQNRLIVGQVSDILAQLATSAPAPVHGTDVSSVTLSDF